MSAFLRKPDFAEEGRDWPNREASRFIAAGGLRWHVQILGEGPDLLLLHGAGAASHSFRDLAPLLAARFRVIVPDLPGHGFTETPVGDGLSLEGMARSLKALLAALGVAPDLMVGHSAGAAVALKLSLQGLQPTHGVVALNGALEPFPGAAGAVFPVLARLLFLNPFAVLGFSWRARGPMAVERLIAQTGSRIDARGLGLYRALLSCPGHVAGALGMMSRWDLTPLQEDLVRVEVGVLLIAGAKDQAVPSRVSEAAARRIPRARTAILPELGHLAHEEDPSGVAALILAHADEA